MTTADDIAVRARPVTDDEARHLWEHGWVKLEGLLDAETTARLLAGAKTLMGEDGDAAELREGVDKHYDWWQDYHWPSRDDPAFDKVVRDPVLGRNAARLFGRDMPMLSITNLLVPKLPAEGKGGQATAWHQDAGIPFRCTSVALWIALDEVTPDMGSMRFHDRSHKLGTLVDGPVPDNYPLLGDCALTPPMTLAPGDATVHNNQCVHGAPANGTDRTRWGFIINYFPADAPYTGASSHHTDDIRAELEVGKATRHPKFPLVYSPGVV
jgi:hypothetical protein